MSTPKIKTKRLGLRDWKESDLIPFAEMCADEAVMQYFPNTLTFQESSALIDRFKKHFIEYGYTYYAVEILETKEFIGFTGLAMQLWESDFTPTVDIGWRLKQTAWGKGYATEAAKACLVYAAKKTTIKEVISVCTLKNTASEHVMKKIEMEFVKNFEHPKLEKHPQLNPCVLYKKTI